MSKKTSYFMCISISVISLFLISDIKWYSESEKHLRENDKLNKKVKTTLKKKHSLRVMCISGGVTFDKAITLYHSYIFICYEILSLQELKKKFLMSMLESLYLINNCKNTKGLQVERPFTIQNLNFVVYCRASDCGPTYEFCIENTHGEIKIKYYDKFQKKNISTMKFSDLMREFQKEIPQHLRITARQNFHFLFKSVKDFRQRSFLVTNDSEI